MIQDSRSAEEAAVMRVAQQLCAAIRTAPKARGIDMIETLILSGDELTKLSQEMISYAGGFEEVPFFVRDANNILVSTAVVLAGTRTSRRKLNAACKLCGFDNCSECAKHGARCAYDLIDLGIALGSAVALAADMRIDNRIMFSVGQSARSMGYLPDCSAVMGIPLSATKKSPYFDRPPV